MHGHGHNSRGRGRGGGRGRGDHSHQTTGINMGGTPKHLIPTTVGMPGATVGVGAAPGAVPGFG